MIKIVIFDVDDTLLSFSGYVKEAMKKGFALYGLREYEDYMYDVFKRINDGFWKRIEQGTLMFEELRDIRWNTIFKELDIDFDGKMFEDFFRKELFSSAILEPGVMELLDYLKTRYVLCVASNGPYEQQINRLKVSGLYEYFEGCYISSMVGAQKPEAQFFEYCFKDLASKGYSDIAPGEVMIIGDSMSADIGGGKCYGLQTCLYSKNGRTKEDAPEADYIVNKLTDIMDIL